MLKAFFGKNIPEFVEFLPAFSKILYFYEAFLDEDFYKVIGFAQRNIKVLRKVPLGKVFPGRKQAQNIENVFFNSLFNH